MILGKMRANGVHTHAVAERSGPFALLIDRF